MPLTSKPQNSDYKYQVGGSLQVDAPSYVERQADIDFYNGLKAGEFCYVLNSRQMGKSSLRVQTMRKLQADGIACGVIDITAIGSQDITPAEWYLGVLRRLVRSFTPKVKALTWWGDCSGLSPVQRLSEFIESVLLLEVSQNIVIFIDEIDSVAKLNFKDDFLALLRACYNKRADNPAYQRLTFALLGVATPYDLIQDKNRTPFNIGRAIELNGFHLSEAQPLAQGLVERVTNPQVVLQEVLAWSGGQPFLTQKLCQLVLTSSSPIPAGSEANYIENLVRSRVIENWESTDEPEHLKTIRDRLLRSEKHSFRLLELYQQILLRSEITADGSPEQMELRLSGLVVKQQGSLRVYNRIYESVFNLSWVDKALSDLRPYPQVLERRLQTVLLLSVVAGAVIMVMRHLGMLQPLELLAFDQSMRLRPNEGPDLRLLVVTITEDDFKLPEQQQRIGTLSDRSLALLLQKLGQLKPRAIGLDIYHDFPFDPLEADLATRMRRNDGFIAICKLSGGKKQAVGVSPPPEIPAARLGFSDVVRDRDLILRRQLLAVTPSPESPCKARYSLSLQLARQYLAQEGIRLQLTPFGYLQLGTVVFKPLEVPSGGYQQLDARGHQVLLNYRSSREIAQQVTLTQVLRGQFNPNWVKDRVVLIGVDAESVKDTFLTPYSVDGWSGKLVPGVLIHAQMVSQILSAVLEGRSLLSVWPVWGEVLWIWGWSLVGGMLALHRGSRLHLALAVGAALGTLYGFCFVLLLKGVWVPLVPSVLVFVTSGGMVMAYTASQTRLNK